MTPSGPIRTGWFGTDLGSYRATDGTYGLFFDDSTAPLTGFDGTFGWLEPRRDPGDSVDPEDGEGIEYMVPVAPQTSVTVAAMPGLPPSFVYFMSRPELTGAIPTCTLCFWNVADSPIPSPLGDGAAMLRFMNDQQDVLLWWLYLAADGGHRVVCGSIPYDEQMVDAAQAARDLVNVAPDFESFLYRFWVENLAWYELNGFGRADVTLSPAVRRYLARYSTPPATEES